MLPPLKLTDLDQIFTGGTSHHGLPPCKISSKSEHFKYQKLHLKVKNKKSATFKQKIAVTFLSEEILHWFFFVITQYNIYCQVNHLFSRKKMVDFLPLVKLKCHDNFHRVLFIHSFNQKERLFIEDATSAYLAFFS